MYIQFGRVPELNFGVYAGSNPIQDCSVFFSFTNSLVVLLCFALFLSRSYKYAMNCTRDLIQWLIYMLLTKPIKF